MDNEKKQYALIEQDGVRTVIPAELVTGDNFKDAKRIEMILEFNHDLYTWDEDYNLILKTELKKSLRIQELRAILSSHTEDSIQVWRAFDDWDERVKQAMNAHLELRELEGRSSIIIKEEFR